MKLFLTFLEKFQDIKAKIADNLSLRTILVSSCVLQIFGVVSLISYLYFKNSQQTVDAVAIQLQNEIILRVEDNLTSYLNMTQQINQQNLQLINLGMLNLENLSAWEKYLWKTSQEFPQVNRIGVANQKGEYRLLQKSKNGEITLSIIDQSTDFDFQIFKTNTKGDKTHLVKVIKNLDVRQRPWYKDALETGKPVWSRVYPALTEPTLLISATAPIYKDNHQEIEGAIMTTIKLEYLGKFLKGLKIAKNGEVFIIDRAGNLIATSTEEPLFHLEGQEMKLIPMIESRHLMTRTTAQYLLNEFGELKFLRDVSYRHLNLNKTRHLLTLKSYRNQEGLDWFIILVIPEADFMESVYTHNRITVILCILALVIATIISIFIFRWITQPIMTLNQATKKITQGQWDYNLEMINRHDEIGDLAQSFQSMATQLQDSLNTLENRVSERTAELVEINHQLEITKEKAESANQAKSTFIANVSHELRSPLNAILGFSQLMSRSKNLPPEFIQYVSTIHRNGEHLLTLINNILDLAKVEAGKMTLNPNNFDLYYLLEDLKAMFNLQAENKGIKLQFERVTPIPQYVRTDELKLRQVLINLLSNALKFTHEGSISVIVSGENQHYLENSKATINFKVKDTGVGIAPEELTHIFESFSQTQSGKKLEEGTGLGLAISRKFVELLGGDITVNSTVDTGTTFEFNIEVTVLKSSLL